MSSPETSITIRMPNWVHWLLVLGAAAAGLVLGLLVKPFVRWIVDLIGEAPGPLRVAAELPVGWAVLVLTVVGALIGVWLSAEAAKESLVVTIGPTDVQLNQDGNARYLAKADIGEVFYDRKELVFLDADTRELARNKATDLNREVLRESIERFGYPWRGASDPREQEFQQWVDGRPDLVEEQQRLLRSRARALRDKQRGTAAELAEQLQEAGVVVRDRAEAQEYRKLPR
ncbi:hypothetical protein EV191_12013 [Tamaricihabitans halophyticus]|uniref:DUF308 domain-containing protein n=1 Tax=Tamaricihabitans halophyticus TaxID=1262583 RepID=A0A4R2Q5T4_9PSEU|nr:hypothetical protein [Tamaricihabitans halophyticus]TCP43859.1 hypothetical protein EV191_12013 [Tamaricihabitans halophyticus]